MEDKYMVFTLEGEDFTQESNPIDTYEKVEEFCKHLKCHYLICKIIKYI